MNPVLLGAVVVLLIPALASWRTAWRLPAAVGTTVGLAAAVVAALAAPPGPAELRPWGALASGLLAAIGGGPFTAEALTWAKKSADEEAERELAEQFDSAELAEFATQARADRRAEGPPPQLRGGKWIGVLERGGVAVSLLAGWPEGIPIVLAVKALGRYPELQAGTTERFIIGTFTSVWWAVAACGVVLL